MEQALYISFQLKRSKINKKGLAPIYIRITVDGKRVELSTHRSIYPPSWDQTVGRALGYGNEAVILNNYLDSLRSKVQRQYNILESLNQEITAISIKNKLNGTSEKKQSLVGTFQFHNEIIRQKVGPDYSLITYKHYKASLAKVKGFINHQYHKSDMFLDDLKHQFVTNFELYLKNHDNCSHNTTMKHIIRLKKVVRFAMHNDWINRNPFINYRCTMKDTNRGFLTQDELYVLENKIITLHRLDKVRDIFIFCCYTGLAWSDVTALTTENITRNIDGNNCLTFYRKKTGTRCSIPLLHPAQMIIDKYKEDPESNEKGCLLPVNSNQRMNGYLKEIADICGITKKLTMHLARHTFATTVTLANGVPIETVSRMLGHTSIKTTQIYSKVVDSKINQDMKILKDKIATKAGKNVYKQKVG